MIIAILIIFPPELLKHTALGICVAFAASQSAILSAVSPALDPAEFVAN